jgi:hypothetical protein
MRNVVNKKGHDNCTHKVFIIMPLKSYQTFTDATMNQYFNSLTHP